MKQKLSLFALAFIAVCAFAAQKVFKAPADGEPEKIVFENGVTYTDFQEFTTENVKLVLGKDTQWKKNVAKSFKGDYMTPFSQTVLEEDESGEMVEKSRLIYLVGNKNPKDDLDNTGGGFDGTAGANHKLPQSGTYYMITPAVNGTVLLGMVLNENKEFFIIDATDAVETPILDGDGNPTGASTLNVVNDNAVFQHDAFKVCAEDGTELEYMDAAPAEGNALIDGGKGGVKVVTKITGTAEFDVQANHTYYVFCTGSKLTIVGLLFTPSAAAEPEDIEISPASGDISAALEEASAGKLVRNITINLTEGAAYTMSAPIVAPAGLVINGNGATIDASAVDAALFQLSTTPAVEAVNDYFRVDNMKIANVTITGVKHNIIYDNNTKYCVVDLTIENALIGLATESVSNDALIAFQAGGVKDFTVKNSTVYGNAVANYFIRYNNNSRLDRYGFDKETEFQTMTYLNNTFYKVIKDGGQWGNYNGISGQVFSKFDIQKNIWVDCSTDIIRRLAGGRFNGSNPMTFDLNTYYYNGADRSANEASYDNSGNILTTDPKFADAANADFHIFAGSDQAKYQTGDPRWFVEYDESLAPPTDITISPAEGDIYAALAAAEEGVKKVGNITINLTEGAAYTVSAPIVAPAGLVINGNGATIDASAVDAALFQLSTTPSAEAVNDYFRVESMKIADVTITGVKHNIIYDNNTKYCVVDLTIENALIGLATESVSNDALIAFQAGGVKDFTVKNSTVYGNAVANYFIRYNNNSRLDRYGFDKETEFQTMTYLNNTFYKVIKDGGQWGNYNGISGQVFSKFDIQKNIWVDCSTDIIRRLAGGRFNGSNPMTFAYNTYFKDGEDLSSSEANYDNSGNILTTNPEFADAANADFHIGASTDQAQYQTGDPRWLVEYVAPVTENVLWSSEEPVAADWNENIKILPEKFADAKVGDIIHVKIASVAEDATTSNWKAQAALQTPAWTNLEAGVVLDPTIEEAAFVLTGDILSLIKSEGGLLISGTNYTTKEVTLEVTEITGSDASIWVGKETGKPTINMNHFLNANAKAGVKAGDIIRITANKLADGYMVLSYSGSDTGWSWKDYEGYEATATETGFDVVVTEGMIDQLKKDGLIINQEGYELTQVEIVEGVVDGINNIRTADVENGKWYNLQGVEVQNPVKGIYIHNGKKVIVK